MGCSHGSPESSSPMTAVSPETGVPLIEGTFHYGSTSCRSDLFRLLLPALRAPAAKSVPSQAFHSKCIQCMSFLHLVTHDDLFPLSPRVPRLP